MASATRRKTHPGKLHARRSLGKQKPFRKGGQSREGRQQPYRGAPRHVTSSSCGAALTGLTAPREQETETSEGSERERERESKRTSEQSAACRNSPDGGRERESTPSQKVSRKISDPTSSSSHHGHLERFFYEFLSFVSLFAPYLVSCGLATARLRSR